MAQFLVSAKNQNHLISPGCQGHLSHHLNYEITVLHLHCVLYLYLGVSI